MNRHASTAIALGIALSLVATTRAEAQRDTTRRAVSEQRIPVSKDQAVVRESRGEVALAPELARIATLEGTVASLEQRLAMAEASAANMALRTAELERQVTMLRDSLGIVNAELANARAEFAARAAALSDSMQLLNGRFARLRNGSLFGHSGFYIGLGSGVNLTTGALHDIGYSQGPNFIVPIGWSKPGVPLGIRTEWGVQSFEGAVVPGFQNVDPVLYTATAVATLNMPMNNAKTNTFYLMGGGGAFLFHRFGTTSALNDRFGNETKDVLKWGLTGGAGLEFHILGASSLFVQSSFTNVFAEKSKLNLANDNKNLRWVPLTAGIVLR
jgi:hypothetical protein